MTTAFANVDCNANPGQVHIDMGGRRLRHVIAFAFPGCEDYGYRGFNPRVPCARVVGWDHADLYPTLADARENMERVEPTLRPFAFVATAII